MSSSKLRLEELAQNLPQLVTENSQKFYETLVDKLEKSLREGERSEEVSSSDAWRKSDG